MDTMENPRPETGTYAWDNSWVDARRRLELLEQCWDPGSHETLRSVGPQPGWRCLEVGGGGGSIARWLCDAVGPSGAVVTIDLDTRFLALGPYSGAGFVWDLERLRGTLRDMDLDW